MSKISREKQIKYLIYEKSEIIKQLKKEIKELQGEKDSLYGVKKLERKRQNEKRN